jgi:hypothetical protein
VRIRVEIRDTEPFMREGTYVYDSGEIGDRAMFSVLSDIDAYVLKSLASLRVLRVMKEAQA